MHSCSAATVLQVQEINVGNDEATTLGQYQWPPHSCPATVPEEGEAYPNLLGKKGYVVVVVVV